VGALWVCLGALAVLASALPLVARSGSGQIAWAGLPQVREALAPLFEQGPPALWSLALAVFAAFTVFTGAGLLLLRPWARALAGALSFTLGACAGGFAILASVRMEGQPITPAGVAVLSAGCVLGAGFIAFGFVLGAQASLRVFTGSEPRLPIAPAARCPTCGSGLDLIKARCPKCDAEFQVLTEPKRARLVDAGMGREYTISLRKLNRIGREMPGYEVQLDHRSVSGNHASIEYHQGRFYLHAHDDTFGTYVNQRRTRDSEIQNQDMLTFGQAEYRFVVDF
jgi:hypothetical protein